ncbi:uncharacterized protein TM35_000112030 [Trypanosoma theileri]|uniref:Uncharacterized protein n=1 Tax=Trypanosoma theileri TaxID=67003 RepID=A0A1X0NZN1_9TRYP|nr:uncharacterized protein TM35_000112030 [Trypanosoma theileri]ORC89669.1 hypothetical protein TM35_000112030 [Trypanosoma theileri]
MHDEAQRQHQSLQIIELLIDLIHGDLVCGDKACRRVVDALIAIYENAIQTLVTNETLLTSSVKGAINAYCARHVLRAAPELLITSKEAAAAYKQIADVLINVEEMKDIGEAIAKELSHLTRRLETRRFSHLLDLMGIAVVLYMQKAAKEHEEEKAQGVLLLEPESAFWVSVKRFLAATIIIPTTSPTRATSTEGDMNNHNKSPSNNNNNNNNRKSSKRVRVEEEDKEVSASNSTPPRGFSEEMRRVVISPIRDRRFLGINTQRLACAQEPEVSPHTDKQQKLNNREKGKNGEVEEEQIHVGTAVNGRAILQQNNSVSRMIEEMDGDHSKMIENTSIGLDTIDNSMETSHKPSTLQKRKDVIVAGVDDSSVSLLGGDVQERSYFLCAETKRYEPVSNRGFFS